MIDWPEHLVNGIALRRSVLFLGAGISANSTNDKGEHPKTWHQLLLDTIIQVFTDMRRECLTLESSAAA